MVTTIERTPPGLWRSYAGKKSGSIIFFLVVM